MRSIRARLLVFLLLAAAVIAVFIGFLSYRQTLRDNEALFDYQLRQIALTLRDQGVVPVPRFPDGSEEMPDLVVQIWTANGTVMYMSRPGAPLLDKAILGYADVFAGNRRWRVFSMEARDRIIQVAQPFELRRDLAAAAALRSLMPLAAFALLMALLIGWVVARSLAPLNRVAREVEQQSARSLNSVSEQDVPSEVAPLVRALNALLMRLKHAFSSQRAFVADAAHELRSPLTALKLQLQLLARATDESAKETALQKLEEGVDRATHLIEQLLTAARTDPSDTVIRLQPTDLAELARHAIADVFSLAQQRGTEIELQAPDSVIISADPATLRILVRNLLDNAVRYSPPGGKVQTSIANGGAAIVLTVEDSGPGIPEEDRERVFDRFYRKQADEQSGTGLGLAIVKNIAEQHGAHVTLDRSALGGLKAAVAFPLPSP